jgi:hypothetical protein
LVNNKKGGFKLDHPALTERWIELLKSMLNFDFTKRPSFNDIKLTLKKFMPTQDKLPQVRP